MVDRKISNLNEIVGVPAEDDVFAVVDTDASETKKVSFSKLAGVVDPEGDKIWEDPVIDKDLSDPPGAPTDGDRYIVAPAGNWYNPAWKFRRALTTDNALITVDETNAVVTIQINTVDDPGSASLFTEAQASSADLVFCDSDGVTSLSFDIERWDVGNEILVARIRIPLLPSGVPDTIFLYYGSDIAHYTPPEGTYPSTWGLFYEMRDTGLDATAYSRNITEVEGAPAESSDRSGYTVTFHGDPDGWSLRDMAYLGQSWGTRTCAAIVRTGTDIVSRQVIFAEGGTTNGYTLYTRNNKIHAKWWSKNFVVYPGAYNLETDTVAPGIDASGDISINTEYYIVTVFDESGDAYRLFVNGVEHDIGAHTWPNEMGAHGSGGGLAYTGVTGKRFDNGNAGGNSNYLGGVDVGDIKEFNVCDDAWSLNRHITWFNNRSDNANFWTIGAEVDQTGAGGAWVGHDNDITEWNGAIWGFTAPVDGMTVWVSDESRHYTYDGDESVWKVSYGLMSHDTLSNIQGGTYGPPAEQHHMTNAEHTEATREAAETQNGLMPAGKMDNWDQAYADTIELKTRLRTTYLFGQALAGIIPGCVDAGLGIAGTTVCAIGPTDQAAVGYVMIRAGTMTGVSMSQSQDLAAPGITDSYTIKVYRDNTLMTSWIVEDGVNEFEYIDDEVDADIAQGEELVVTITDNNTPSLNGLLHLVVVVEISETF